MAHVMRYKLLGTLDSGEEMSPEAQAIFAQYEADGKITDFDTTTGLAGTLCYVRFATEEDCDAYLAAMAEINEETTSGANRTDFTRYDE